MLLAIAVGFLDAAGRAEAQIEDYRSGRRAVAGHGQAKRPAPIPLRPLQLWAEDLLASGDAAGGDRANSKQALRLKPDFRRGGK